MESSALPDTSIPPTTASVSPRPRRPEDAAALDGISLADVRGLQDLPEDAQLALTKSARIEVLNTGEELNSFAVALILSGNVNIMPAIAEVACARATAGEVVFTEGHLRDTVMLRVVADANETRLAFWDARTLGQHTANCPWVDADLRSIADRFQALAGVAMGHLGERLDDNLRAMVTDRCELVRLSPSEILLREGETVNGMYVLGAGHLELLRAKPCESSSTLVISCLRPR